MRQAETRDHPRSGKDLLVTALAAATPGHILRDGIAAASPAILAAMVEMAGRHSVLGLLSTRLTTVGAVLPTHLAGQVAEAHRQSVGRHLLAVRTVSRLTAALDARFLIVKGPALAIGYHGDSASRTYSDIDVLVDRTDFTAALSALETAGFEPLATNWSGFVRHGVAEVPLGSVDGMLAIDLHFHIVGLARDRRELGIDVGVIMNRAVSVDIAGTSNLTTDPVDTLTHLCVNTGLDGARRLKGMLDIDAVVRSGRVDTDEFVRRARAAGVHLLASAVLQRCARFLDTDGAADLASALEPWSGWLLANDLLDRSRRRPMPDRGVAPGWLLSAGRPSMSATAAVVKHNLEEAIDKARGRPGLSGANGELDWKGGDGRSMAAYLAWVNSPVPLRVESPDDPDVVHAALRHHQPRSTRLIAASHRSTGARGRTRRWLVRDDDGSLLAAVVAVHWSVGLTHAFVVLLDTRATPAVSRLLDWDGVTRISAFEPDIAPLRAIGSRWGHEVAETVAAQPPGFVWEPPTTSTRPATKRDLDEIIELRQASSGDVLPSPNQLRRLQRALIEELTFVLHEDGRIIGCISRQAWTPEWDIWGHMDVHPEHRGRGHSWRLLAAGVAHTRQREAGGMVFVAATNPMPLPEDAVLPDRWLTVLLKPPRRFRGEPRLHRLLGDVRRRRMQARPTRGVPPLQRPVNAPDDLITQRRTQQALQEGD